MVAATVERGESCTCYIEFNQLPCDETNSSICAVLLAYPLQVGTYETGVDLLKIVVALAQSCY